MQYLQIQIWFQSKSFYTSLTSFSNSYHKFSASLDLSLLKYFKTQSFTTIHWILNQGLDELVKNGAHLKEIIYISSDKNEHGNLKWMHNTFSYRDYSYISLLNGWEGLTFPTDSNTVSKIQTVKQIKLDNNSNLSFKTRHIESIHLRRGGRHYLPTI